MRYKCVKKIQLPLAIFVRGRDRSAKIFYGAGTMTGSVMKRLNQQKEERGIDMKIILLQDDKKLGKKGDLIEVSEGYARNFILPKKLGVEATPKNMNDLKLQRANSDRIAQEQLDAAKALAALLEDKQVVVKIKAGEGGRAFGSVSSKEIAAACKEQHGIELDKKKIQLPESLKNFGSYEVAIKLHPQVTGKLTVKVAEA